MDSISGESATFSAAEVVESTAYATAIIGDDQVNGRLTNLERQLRRLLG